LLRGTTLLPLEKRGCFGVAITGETRRRLARGITWGSPAKPALTLQGSRRVRPWMILCAPRTPCRAHTSLSRLA